MLVLKGKVIDINNILNSYEKKGEGDTGYFEKDELKAMIDELAKSILNYGAEQILKKWIPVKKSFSLEYHLNKLGKSELTTIAVNFCIDKASTLRKEELKNKILELYEDRVNMFLENMDRERFVYLLDLVNKNGYGENIENENIGHIFYFRERALLFTGKIKNENVIIMPEELQKIIKDKNNLELVNKFEKNEELIKLFWGMCYYYGIIDLKHFKELVVKYVDFDTSKMNMKIILRDGAEYYGGFNFNGYTGRDIMVEDSQYLLIEQIRRFDLDFYPLKKEELLNAAREDYMEETEAYKRLHSFLTSNYNINSNQAKDLIFYLQCSFKNEKDLDEIVDGFMDNFDISDVKEASILIHEIYRFANNTRQSILKGYTPEELNTTLPKEKLSLKGVRPCISEE